MIRTTKILLAAAIAMFGMQQSRAQQSPANAAIENIMSRASVRHFKPTPINADAQQTLLRAAMAAPSSRSMQPWHFVVLNSRESIDKLAGSLRNGAQIKGAPLVIVVCGDTTRMQQGEARDFWVEDVSASSQNILLAAHALNLGAVWTSVYPVSAKVKAFAKALQLPENLIPFNCILIGQPDENVEPQDKWDEQKITYK